MVSCRWKYLSLIVPVGLILSMGCTRRPAKVLDEQEMVELLADMQLAEAYYHLSGHTPGVSNPSEEIGQQVLAMHNVTQEELDSTLSYYGRNLDDYSLLYEKVDAEINRRRKRLDKIMPDVTKIDGSELWNRGQFGYVSPLGTTDGWIFSVTDPSVDKGEKITWSLHLTDPVPMKGILGVEYEEGNSEIVSLNFTGKKKIEFVLQTDTAGKVRRLFGNLAAESKNNLPLYADSIRLYTSPFDSIEFENRRNKRKYGSLESVIQKDRIIPKPESLSKTESDSLSLSDRIASETNP